MPELVHTVAGGLAPLAVAYFLGSACLRGMEAPRVLALAVGAALESLLIFLLVVGGRVSWASFALVAAAAVALQFAAKPEFRNEPAAAPLDGWPRRLVIALFSLFGVLYLTYALAPETEFDGCAYHLGLPAEYWRLGGFPDRVGFFEMLPQGMEMLYVPALAVGGSAAAKLCHFGFLAATPGLMLMLARLLGLRDLAAWLAAALYCFSPVTGVAGTAVHNDAPLVFFVLALLYALLRWHAGGGLRWAALAGLMAGFCYAVKLPGLLAPAAALGFVFFRGRREAWPAALVMASTAALLIAPWMVRAWVSTGNPFAPLLNAWFPNPFFFPGPERDLTTNFRGYYGNFTWSGAVASLVRGPWLEGIFGPWWLLLPAGLVALRRRSGRILWLAAALAAVPWFLNHGTRFLMPFAALAALTLAMLLPRRWALGLLLGHAVLSWPAVARLYAYPGTWLFKEFPWRVAVGLEHQAAYLARVMPEYQIANLLKKTEPGARIFSTAGAPRLYVSSDVLEFWHSAEANRMFDTLKAGAMPGYQPLVDVRVDFPSQPLRGMRFRRARAIADEWVIHEVELYAGAGRVETGPRWTLDAWPNPWETPLAFDRNRATRWRTWDRVPREAYFEVQFGAPLELSRAVLVSAPEMCSIELVAEGVDAGGHWKRLGETACLVREREDLRRAAVRSLAKAGFRYLLLEIGNSGAGLLGAAVEGHEFEWGIEEAAAVERWRLYRLPRPGN